MARAKKKAKSRADELLDELLKDCKSPEDILGKHGLLEQLSKRAIERALAGELTTHLGYPAHERADQPRENTRNGSSAKTLLSDHGALAIEIPRDRLGSFEPQLIPKGERRLKRIDEQIIALYTRGMTTRDIQAHLLEIYGVEISASLISNVTAEVSADAQAWQNRPLEAMYPIVYFDALFVKTRQSGASSSRAVYLALAINMEGRKELLGLWIAETEGASFWLSVLTELQNRGMRDCLIACVDGLNGFDKAIETVFPRTCEDRTPLSPHLIGHAKLNGKKIRVMFDTGAWRSLLTLNAAARAGIEPEDDGVIAAGISRGLGKGTTENSLARFDTLDLGGEVIRNARLRIGDAKLFGTDMLLGADFFLSHRVYVASKQNKIYFTYNGGPVFDLRSNPNESKAPTAGPASAAVIASSETSSSSDPALDAATLRRRGTASAGRHDFEAAIADLDRAVALDATDAENFYERGLARWQYRQPIRAAADFDAALKLSPNHVQALLARGTLRLRGGNEADASHDFEEALKLSPKDPAVGLRVVDAYHEAGNFHVAIERLNTWIDANPKDDRVPRALNQRCWSRAMLGKDLELARADCDNALKKGAKNSAVYDSRALVWLQLGNFDKAIADYKEALELQPKKASSLYGLGLAELKKGLKDSGQSNMQAALELNPAVAMVYQKAGVTP